MKEYSRDFKVKTIFIAQNHFDELGGKMIVIYPHMYGNVSLYDAYQFDQYGTSSPKLMDDIVAASAESEKRTKLRITATDGDVYEFLSIVEYVNNIDYGPDYMYNAPYFAHEINLYLDTHPKNQRMIQLYHEYVDKANQARENFEKEFGPLFVTNSQSENNFDWIKGPWPWDYQC